jgi:hypothetical protein
VQVGHDKILIIHSCTCSAVIGQIITSGGKIKNYAPDLALVLFYVKLNTIYCINAQTGDLILIKLSSAYAPSGPTAQLITFYLVA